jgi:hypothetical protein
MEFFSALAMAVLSPVVKAVIGGRSLGSADAGEMASSAMGQILSALLSGQDETARALQMVEAKLDRLLVAPYRQEMETGYLNLREARPDHRLLADRNRLIDAAQQSFLRAIAVAPRPTDQVIPGVCVAMTWLLKGSPLDCLRNLDEASNVALGSTLTASARYAQPDASEVAALRTANTGLLGRARALVDSGVATDDPSSIGPRAQLRKAAAIERDDSMTTFNEIQALRIGLDERPELCPVIRGFWEPGHEEITGSQPNSVQTNWVFHNNNPVFNPIRGTAVTLAGVATDVSELRVTAAPPVGSIRSFHVIDAVVALGSSGLSPDVRLSAAGEWPVLGRPEPDPETDSAQGPVPYLAAQVGLSLWDGEKVRLDLGPVSVALRLRTVTAPKRLVLSLHGLNAPRGAPAATFFGLVEHPIASTG